MEELFNEYSEQIRKNFSSFLNIKEDYFSTINRWGRDVIHRLRTFLQNGKLIRGSVVLFSQEMFGSRIDTESFKVAIAIELFHSGLLIHDDIIDTDKLRRGDPSVYYQYTKEALAEKMADPQQFGVSMGICAGDISFFIAFELLSGLKIDIGHKEKIMSLFFSEFISVGLGQMQDIYSGQSPNEPGEEDIFKLYLYKTARYTYSLPFMLGGMLAGIPDIELEHIEKFGEYLGLIFQMKDDELGIFGKKSDFGKPIGSDIKENKKTFYYLYLFRNAAEEEQLRLRNIFGSSDISDESISYVHKLIGKYNIKESIDMKVEHYKKSAEEVIGKMNIDSNYKSRLNMILRYNLNRTK